MVIYNNTRNITGHISKREIVTAAASCKTNNPFFVTAYPYTVSVKIRMVDECILKLSLCKWLIIIFCSLTIPKLYNCRVIFN
ncbi:hypothetical protein D3C81_1843990 [compost metagenome]